MGQIEITPDNALDNIADLDLQIWITSPDADHFITDCPIDASYHVTALANWGIADVHISVNTELYYWADGATGHDTHDICLTAFSGKLKDAQGFLGNLARRIDGDF